MEVRTLRLKIKIDAPKASKMIQEAIERADKIPDQERVAFVLAAAAAIAEHCCTIEGPLIGADLNDGAPG